MKSLLFFFTLFTPLLVSANTENASDKLFIDCNYSVSVAANISSELGIQTNKTTNSNFNLTFVVTKKNKVGVIIGNSGAVNVTSVWGENKLTFIEVTQNGTVQTTAIYGTRKGKKASVHSRTSGGEDYEMPSQYYGFCNIK